MFVDLILFKMILAVRVKAVKPQKIRKRETKRTIKKVKTKGREMRRGNERKELKKEEDRIGEDE